MQKACDLPMENAGTCEDDDKCLQAKPGWGLGDGGPWTCANAAEYCVMYSGDMAGCCPVTCHTCPPGTSGGGRCTKKLFHGMGKLYDQCLHVRTTCDSGDDVECLNNGIIPHKQATVYSGEEYMSVFGIPKSLNFTIGVPKNDLSLSKTRRRSSPLDLLERAGGYDLPEQPILSKKCGFTVFSKIAVAARARLSRDVYKNVPMKNPGCCVGSSCVDGNACVDRSDNCA